MFRGFIQQHPTMSWDELRTQLELLLVEDVQAGPDGQPYTSELRKAATRSAEIMTLFESYLAGKGMH